MTNPNRAENAAPDLSKPLRPVLKTLVLGLLVGASVFLAGRFSGVAIAADPIPISEVKVTLFGQSCLLTGPATPAVLTKIHSISPEKIPTEQNEEQLHQSIDTLIKATGLPQPVEIYRERMTQWLEARSAFRKTLGLATKSGKSADLIQEAKKWIARSTTGTQRTRDTRGKDFEALVKKLELKTRVSAWPKETRDLVIETFERSIDEYPEADFHRAIELLKIRYNCALE